ncbi:SDR family NAD(P)-dependent oxidoreductase [Gayadomonas joobiniege]|uniref:SDR family NAD(P)-dependent oxidoreductase n=1 Tax=Gayadomonas joobiniege TaxID=1234606 RepID=UPI00035C0D8D|nr:SDR family oxidoreductase [Gayadomonas joobiniege]
MRLNNKVIFLTGGAHGIGWACAKAYINEGANLVIADINATQAECKLADYKGPHLSIQCDVRCDQSVAAAIAKTVKEFGRIDVIHNNAGIGAPTKSIDKTSLEEWEQVQNTNLKSVFLTARHGIAALKKSRGCILNTSSMAGVIGQADHAAYAATKGGINALTKSMALDFAAFGIRVNAICPAGAWTPMLREWVNEQAEPQQMQNYLNNIHALGYCPEGDVIASSALYLISDDARFVTGHIMHVSGGAELGYRHLPPASGMPTKGE